MGLFHGRVVYFDTIYSVYKIHKVDYDILNCAKSRNIRKGK